MTVQRWTDEMLDNLASSTTELRESVTELREGSTELRESVTELREGFADVQENITEMKYPAAASCGVSRKGITVIVEL